MADENANDVNQTAAPQEPATTAPSTDDNKAPEVASDPIADILGSDDNSSTSEHRPKDQPKAKEEPKTEEPKEETPEEPKPEEDTEPTEQPRGKDGKFRKEQLNTEIRDLVGQRNALRQEVEQLNSQVYQPQSTEDLQEQGYSPEMAAIMQMQQEREIERYNNQVAEAQLTIETESSRVMNDFPIFNPESSEYKPELAQQAGQLLQNALVFDQNTGQVIGSNVSPYQLYQTLAGTYQASQTDGQLKGQKAERQMMDSADVTSNAAPPKPKTDPIMAIFDSDD